MKQKVLTAAVTAWLVVPAASVFGADVMDLDPIFVSAQRDVRAGGYVYTNSRLGILGTVDVMNVPFSQVSMTEDAVADYGASGLPLQQVLVNDPSIRFSSSSPMYSDFSMRGVGMNGTHMYFNGIPSLFSQFRTPPNHMIERIDIMNGPASGLNGTAASSNGTNGGRSAAPGVINIISKRANYTPERSITLAYQSKRNWGMYFDIGDRFGKGQEWGIRTYGGWMGGDLDLTYSGKKERTIGINLDHQGKRSHTNLFIGHIDLRVDGSQRWFSLAKGVDRMPKAPNSRMAYDFPEETKYAHWYVATLNHEQDINDKWKAFINAGSSTWSGYKYNMNAALYIDAEGNFKDNDGHNLMNEKASNHYFQVGVRGELQTGTVHHAVSVSYDRSWMKYWKKNYQSPKNGDLIGGNIYDGMILRPGFYPLPVGGDRPWSYSEHNASITINDLMSFGKWDVLLGATRREGHLRSTTELIRNTNTLPTFGITYRPTEQLSVYAGHSQSFSRGQMVTNEKYNNHNTVLDPVKQKQTEVGVKYNVGKYLATLAYFYNEQGNYEDQTVDGKLYLTQNGMNLYKGVEFSLNGKISDRLTFTGGFLYMDPERKKTKDGLKNGMYVLGVPDFSMVAGLKYKATESVDIIGRIMYNGSAYVNDNHVKVPGYTTVDFGMNWRTAVAKHPLEVHAMVYNLFNKSYWMGRGGSTTFGLSWPRTFVVSAKLSF